MSNQATVQSPEATKTPKNWQETIDGKEASRFTDPCHAASKASMDCLNRNDYDRDQCLDYFRAYRECKAQWLKERREDRRSGKSKV
ncbi:hypothetical protein CPB86DRAFT_872378 [Serendipita vermifera]|nr:hypothetical protein CPB86DRAFT_872378 [Serendipita vermifera]